MSLSTDEGMPSFKIQQVAQRKIYRSHNQKNP
jgi:hypothetical protein